MKELEFFAVTDEIRAELQKSVWTPGERPIVIVPIKFTVEQKTREGFIMFTLGAIYLFKAKLIKKAHLKIKTHLLDCKAIRATQHHIELDRYTEPITLKTESVVPLVRAMLTVLHGFTFGLTTPPQVEEDIRIQVPDTRVTARPKDALIWRALFLGHYYDVKGEQLYTMDYFKRFEGNLAPTILIGPSLHPGNFAAAFGHAIGWESLLRVVVFQNFAPMKFAKMFDSLVANSSTILRIVFSLYRDDHMCAFNRTEIPQTSVNSYEIHKSCGSIVQALLQAVQKHRPLEAIILRDVNFTDIPQWESWIDTACDESNRATSQLRVVELTNLKISAGKVPLNYSLRRLFRPSVKQIRLAGLGLEGSQLLEGCCSCQPQIIELAAIVFDKPIDFELPPGCIRLDLSGSAFSHDALHSLLLSLTTHEHDVPITLLLRSLKIQAGVFDCFATLPFDRLLPTLGEVHFEQNVIDIEQARFLFAFLFTQSSLRHLALQSVNPEDPVQFLKFVLQFVENVPIEGLDISGNWDGPTFAHFLEALAPLAVNLRRLGLAECGLGIEAMGGLNKLLQLCPDLVEVEADGFKPKSECPELAVMALWGTIASHPGILNCDLPFIDTKEAGLSKDSREFRATWEILERKPRASTFVQRDRYVLEICRCSDFATRLRGIWARSSLKKLPAPRKDYQWDSVVAGSDDVFQFE